MRTDCPRRGLSRGCDIIVVWRSHDAGVGGTHDIDMTLA
jgi:hypothetical protein